MACKSRAQVADHPRVVRAGLGHRPRPAGDRQGFRSGTEPEGSIQALVNPL